MAGAAAGDPALPRPIACTTMLLLLLPLMFDAVSDDIGGGDKGEGASTRTASSAIPSSRSCRSMDTASHDEPKPRPELVVAAETDGLNIASSELLPLLFPVPFVAVAVGTTARGELMAAPAGFGLT